MSKKYLHRPRCDNAIVDLYDYLLKNDYSWKDDKNWNVNNPISSIQKIRVNF